MKRAAIISLVLAVLSTSLLVLPQGREVDRQLVRDAVALDRSSPALHAFMQAGTELGTHQPILLGLLVPAIFGGPALRATSGLSLVGVGLNQAITGILKWAVDRTRPDLTNVRHNSSFPSGHASATFGLAWIIAHRHRRAAFWIWAMAIWISASRVFLGRHFPSDVLAGGAIAILCSALALRYSARILALMPVDPGGTARRAEAQETEQPSRVRRRQRAAG